MTPSSARALRRRRVAELRAAEPGLSLRQMADRLGVSRDTVTRDLEEIDRSAAETAPLADTADRPSADPAPQVSAGGGAESATPSAGHAPTAGPESATGPGRPAASAPADLPRRVSAERLEIDLRRWPGLRRDLAVLSATGLSHQELIGQAVTVLAAGFRQGVAAGVIAPGPFVVRDLTVGPYLPARLAPRRPEPTPSEGA